MAARNHKLRVAQRELSKRFVRMRMKLAHTGRRGGLSGDHSFA
jgi:hypothetical protein